MNILVWLFSFFNLLRADAGTTVARQPPQQPQYSYDFYDPPQLAAREATDVVAEETPPSSFWWTDYRNDRLLLKFVDTSEHKVNISRECITETNAMTNTDGFRQALDSVIADIRKTQDYCQGRLGGGGNNNNNSEDKINNNNNNNNNQKEPGGETATDATMTSSSDNNNNNNLQTMLDEAVDAATSVSESFVEQARDMLCVFDEANLKSSDDYIMACQQAGGEIHQSDLISSCVIHQPGQVDELFEYQYKNMDFCFHPAACTKDDIGQAIQDEANSLLHWMEQSLDILSSLTDSVSLQAGDFSVRCKTQVISKETTTKEQEEKEDEEKKDEVSSDDSDDSSDDSGDDVQKEGEEEEEEEDEEKKEGEGEEKMEGEQEEEIKEGEEEKKEDKDELSEEVDKVEDEKKEGEGEEEEEKDSSEDEEEKENDETETLVEESPLTDTTPTSSALPSSPFLLLRRGPMPEDQALSLGSVLLVWLMTPTYLILSALVS
ncbi:hypothetical protein ACA910_011614 [Epithemia clementina (nom. ined.)]